MTKLRDDGHLETDDPVVAACFINHDVRRMGFNGRDIDEPRKVYRVGPDGVLFYGIVSVGYPILIPAKTVAEVVLDHAGKATSEYVVLHEYANCDLDAIDEWLASTRQESDMDEVKRPEDARDVLPPIMGQHDQDIVEYYERKIDRYGTEINRLRDVEIKLRERLERVTEAIHKALPYVGHDDYAMSDSCPACILNKALATEHDTTMEETHERS